MEAAPPSPKPRPTLLRQIIRGALVAGLLVFVFWALYIPSTYQRPFKRGKSLVQLNNLVSACKQYHDIYKKWPTLTETPTKPDFILVLKRNSPLFLQVMTGNPPVGKEYMNPQKINFYEHTGSDINAEKTTPIDAFGNEDIVIIMDTDGDGKIGPFKITLEDFDYESMTVRQTVPLNTDVIAMSPGAGAGAAEAITTWNVTSR